jgi:hypothetical protein
MRESIFLFLSCIILIFTVSVCQAQPSEKEERFIPFKSPRRGDPPGWGPRCTWGDTKPWIIDPYGRGLLLPLDQTGDDVAPKSSPFFNRFGNNEFCVGSLPRCLKEYKTPQQQGKGGRPLCSQGAGSSVLVPKDSD